MKKWRFILVGMALSTRGPVGADAPDPGERDLARDTAHLKKHEKGLSQMQASRGRSAEESNRAQQDMDRSTAELSDHDERESQDAGHLRSVEDHLTAGRIEERAASASYHEARKQYGPDDPRSQATLKTLQEGHAAMGPLRLDRRETQRSIHLDRRRVHNEKTVLDMQKRAVGAASRDLAQDDRRIEKQKDLIANDHSDILDDRPQAEPPH